MRDRATHQALAAHVMAQRELTKMDNALAAYFDAKHKATTLARRATDKVRS